MENKKLVIKIKGLNDYTLESSNPSFDDWIKEIVEKVDEIDLDGITVTSEEDENFDKEGFAEILAESIKEYKAKAKIENDSINDLREKIKTEKESLNSFVESE